MSEIRCPHCDKTFTTEAAVVVPRAAGDMTCPKCGDVQPTAAACRKCGLLADRMAEFARTQDDSHPELAVAWEAVTASWDDPAAHDRFIELAASIEAWPWAARHYRAVLRERPDDARATEQLARITRMAEAVLRASATARPQANTAYRRTIAMLGLLVILLVIGLAYALIVKGVREDQTRPDRPDRPPAHKRK